MNLEELNNSVLLLVLASEKTVTIRRYTLYNRLASENAKTSENKAAVR